MIPEILVPSAISCRGGNCYIEGHLLTPLFCAYVRRIPTHLVWPLTCAVDLRGCGIRESGHQSPDAFHLPPR
jgi:hypothetical protein